MTVIGVLYNLVGLRRLYPQIKQYHDKYKRMSTRKKRYDRPEIDEQAEHRRIHAPKPAGELQVQIRVNVFGLTFGRIGYGN